MRMATLYIVATPIGNLEDVSCRAERILREVDLILCEDTRVTKKLLNHFGIATQTISFHTHSAISRTREIIDGLAAGKNMALVSDAGTPGINDPGGRLIEEVVRQCGEAVSIVPIPGPSAVIAALSISGFPTDSFQYLGFPPHKKGREKFFRAVAAAECTTVFLESPYRILKALESLETLMPERHMMIGRELTKMFESVYRGTPSEVTAALKSDTVKGEFVVVVRRK